MKRDREVIQLKSLFLTSIYSDIKNQQNCSEWRTGYYFAYLGTTRYNRKTTDEHTADIAVFSVKLLGFECRSQTGDLFCYALLAVGYNLDEFCGVKLFRLF